jgi:hypothetical protein
MAELRGAAARGEVRWLDLLTRCHQTPGYAQLHACVHLSLLPCLPPALHDAPAQRAARRRRYPEAAGTACATDCDCFFEAPGPALARRYGAGAWRRVLRGGRRPPRLPSHVLLFDELYAEPRARAVLDALGFARRAAYFHELAYAGRGASGWPGWSARRLLLLTREARGGPGRGYCTRGSGSSCGTSEGVHTPSCDS